MIVTTEEAMVVMDLVLRAERRAELGQLDLAAKDYELLLSARHGPELEARVRVGYARVLHARGELERAADQLELRLPLVSAHELDAARIELLRCWLLLERFADARTLGQSIDRAGLLPEDRVLLGASDALGLAALGQADPADAVLAKAWSELEVQAENREPAPGLPAALLALAGGDVAALRARRIQFDPVPKDVPAELERRCRNMVTAQSAYADAMRLERGHVRLLAGARIAALYQDLHRDILAAPLPAGFTAGEARQLAEGALLLRYRVLLEKAEQMLRITLSGTEPSRATAPRRQELEARLAALSAQRAAQARRLGELPVQASELERVLDTLGPAFDSGAEAAPAGR